MLLAVPALAVLTTSVTPATPTFTGIVQDMRSGVKNLFTTNNTNSLYSVITYTSDYDPFFEMGMGTGKFITNATNPQFPAANQDLLFTTQTFVEVKPNYEAFFFQGSIEIGFFGNESGDRNAMGLLLTSVSNPVDQVEINPLFSYQASNSPAWSASINTNQYTKAEFFHQNLSRPNSAFQKEEAKFKMFQAYDEDLQLFSDAYIFAIDDRMDNSVDFDDGFFYITGEIVPVPEPSAIAAMAIVGLGGLLYIRKRITGRNKNK